MHELLEPPDERKRLLLGNEAIVRAALEAGVGVVAAYPGTPSSEIIDRFAQVGPEAGVYVEYSVNEKVSVEVAAAAAVSGVRSLCSMKHVGLNVAADAFMTLAYVGVKAGMVIVNADDPQLHSSQNEQDNRFYARMAGVPMFEPATPAEAKAMTLEAYRVSEAFGIPVMLRTTTRVNHCRGPVALGPLPEAAPRRGAFAKDPMNLVVIPAVGRKLHGVLLGKLARLEAESERSPWNTVEGEGSLGVVTSGVSYLYVKDALRDLGLEHRVRVLRLGFSFPQPRDRIRTFLQGCGKVLVVEELEPFLEDCVRVVAQESGASCVIGGKGFVSRAFELNTVLVKKAVAKFFGVPYEAPAVLSAPANLPMRPPTLCPGCPHRATYASVKKVFGEEAIYPSDIGCYTLGVLPPLKAADFLICMGSGVSSAGGFSKVLDRPVVAFIGDSTFFHSGMTGLVNAVTHDHRFVLVILDNGTTAMTGHQPHPGVELTARGPITPKVSIESVVRGFGVQNVVVVNPIQVKKTREALEKVKVAAAAGPGPTVVIAKSPCPLHERRMTGKKQTVVFEVTEQCDDVGRCVEEIGCPAFIVEREAERKVVRISGALCSGCSVCAQVCPSIKPKKIGQAPKKSA